ncbi:MAG: hypothetical protein SVS85_01340, partial [Candidatus Nanohaloarchaea archaeon]|nr:hypothetical protein [Candidatus Nanohaloarchaea archaeon]
MSGIAGGEKASRLANRMDHRDVEVLESVRETVSDSTVYSGEGLEEVLEEEGVEGLEDLESDYASAWREDGDIVLARDLLCVRPVFYSKEP